MLCPECKTETYLDHTVTDTETGTTRYFYTCPKKGCPNYLKIINGNEEGREATIQGGVNG